MPQQLVPDTPETKKLKERPRMRDAVTGVTEPDYTSMYFVHTLRFQRK